MSRFGSRRKRAPSGIASGLPSRRRCAGRARRTHRLAPGGCPSPGRGRCGPRASSRERIVPPITGRPACRCPPPRRRRTRPGGRGVVAGALRDVFASPRPSRRASFPARPCLPARAPTACRSRAAKSSCGRRCPPGRARGESAPPRRPPAAAAPVGAVVGKRNPHGGLVGGHGVKRGRVAVGLDPGALPAVLCSAMSRSWAEGASTRGQAGRCLQAGSSRSSRGRRDPPAWWTTGATRADNSTSRVASAFSAGETPRAEPSACPAERRVALSVAEAAAHQA